MASRQLVTTACEQSRAAGVQAGMSLAEARALCPGLTHLPADPDLDRRALEALGRWLTRFSPVVAVDSPDCLLIDLTGCERLFGGIEAVASRVTMALDRLRITARVAVAPTVGAAWALTFGVERSATNFELSFSLEPSLFRFLTTVALRLPPDTIATLHHLGVETIGQLLALDRASLLTRFGPQVLLRIDQLLGRAPEMLRPIEFRSPVRAKMDFDGAITAIEVIWEVLRRLVDELTQQLARIGGGARRVEAEFRRAYSPPVRRTVLLSRASREARNLYQLLRCATENLDVRDGNDFNHAVDGFYCDGFVTIVLSAPAWERIADEQWTADGQPEQASAGEVSRLVEVLSVRLGPQSVVKTSLHDCHLPERAYKTVDGVRADLTPVVITPLPARKPARRRGRSRTYGRMPKPMVADKKSNERSVTESSNKPPTLAEREEPAATRSPTAPTFALRLADPYGDWEPTVPDLPEGADDPDRTDIVQIAAPQEPSSHVPLAARPVNLLPTPRELRVMSASGEPGEEQWPLTFSDGRQTYRITQTIGPERIGAMWWEGRDKTRDYYDVETAEGKRFWVFRVSQSGRWFLHGDFD